LKFHPAHIWENLLFLFILLLVSGLVFGYSYGILEQRAIERGHFSIEEQLDYLETKKDLQEVRRWGEAQYNRFVGILDQEGRAIHHNVLNVESLENQNTHMEIKRARLAGEGQVRRPHSVFGGDYLFSARKVSFNGVDYIIQIGQNFQPESVQVENTWWLIGGIILTLNTLTLISLYFYRSRQNRQLQLLVNSAETYSKSGVYLPTAIPASSAYSILSQSLNQMIQQLEDRFDTIDNQKTELEAILGGMEEEVVVLNPFLKIKRWNRAFEKNVFWKKTSGSSLG
jgi:methyl-accepting chemotaxis protein